jgi:hypothetical protein
VEPRSNSKAQAMSALVENQPFDTKQEEVLEPFASVLVKSEIEVST